MLRNYQIITNYSKNEWEQELRIQNEFIKNIYSTGRIPNIDFDIDLDKVVKLLSSHYLSPFKLFFIEEISSQTLNDFGFENISSDEFNIKWHLFNSERDDRIMQVTSKLTIPSEIKFDSWNMINAFSHPFHSLIIFDLYLLINKDNEKIEDNFFQMIFQMIKNNSNRNTIDLQIITQFKGAGRNIADTYDHITSWLRNKFGDEKVNLSIIVYSKDVCIRDFQSLSFRRLFTNYFEISADKGFNFFRNNGKPGKLQDVKFDFIFYGYNSDRVKSPLVEFKQYVSKVENKPEIGYQQKQINIIGNKENRLLSFSI